MPNQLILWGGFTVFIIAMLAIDLGLFNRKAHAVTAKEAGMWSLVWVSLALAFNLGIYFWRGSETALNFLTGYLIELSLSVDNIFVFILIFSYFSVPAQYQHRVLFWGIIGAQIMRATLILIGSALIAKFHWVLYVFGAFLVFTAYKLAKDEETSVDPEANPVVRVFRRYFPVTERYENERFFVRRAGKTLATPLFIVLLIVETTDLVFALDSIPAIFGVTTDPFIVYTSNVFAILGLRSMYFLLAGVMGLFRYLKVGLSAVLGFIGVKMLIADLYKIPTPVSLGVVFGVLALSVLASVLLPEKEGKEEARAPQQAATTDGRGAVHPDDQGAAE